MPGKTEASRGMTPGRGRAVVLEMLQAEGTHWSNQRARMRSKRDLKKIHWAMAFCLFCVGVLAMLTTYLFIGHLKTTQEACLGQAPLGKESEISHQRAYEPPMAKANKPRAHLTVVQQNPAPNVKDQFPILLWEHDLGLAFIKNRMNYTNKFLVIPESGDYFVYSQVTFRGTTPECGKINKLNRSSKPDYITQIITKVTDSYPEPTKLLTGTKSVCEIGSSWFQPIYLGAVFSMQEGDKLMVNVSDISLVDYTKEDKTFFGAFLL
ncbi:tumor necrosis factor ligand superfamily member 15 [Tachyglossus aculeatus]|uniref:tumor necrosis factor ligand superfamily member 15 n=1 Tax=Tachyglossus aculeatus TaxID=9261 RepID=UPI0018F71C29|nr:tumor necrosis factor ligand superfamily member 15 [Tachyglossus aculeatus]